MKNQKTKYLCLASLMAAIIFVFTQIFHIPSHNGYVHIGDAFVYLAGALLPWPYAMGAGAVGAALADCMSGYAMWAPASILIKALTALCFTAKKEKILCRRIAFGVNACVVKNILAFGNSQETCALFKCFCAELWNFFEL